MVLFNTRLTLPSIYNIHCYKNGFNVPIVYFLLSKIYDYFYGQLSITQLKFDFEIGAHETIIIREIFPDIKLMGCRFYLRYKTNQRYG